MERKRRSLENQAGNTENHVDLATHSLGFHLQRILQKIR